MPRLTITNLTTEQTIAVGNADGFGKPFKIKPAALGTTVVDLTDHEMISVVPQLEALRNALDGNGDPAPKISFVLAGNPSIANDVEVKFGI